MELLSVDFKSGWVSVNLSAQEQEQIHSGELSEVQTLETLEWDGPALSDEDRQAIVDTLSSLSSEVAEDDPDQECVSSQ